MKAMIAGTIVHIYIQSKKDLDLILIILQDGQAMMNGAMEVTAGLLFHMLLPVLITCLM